MLIQGIVSAERTYAKQTIATMNVFTSFHKRSDILPSLLLPSLQHCISFAWAPNRTEFSWRWRAWNYSDSLIRTLTRTSRCWSSVATRGTGHQLLRHILLLFSTCISANTNASASAPVVTPIYTWSKHINDVKVPTGHQRQRFNSTSERRWVSGCVPTWDCKCLGTSMGKVAKS